MKRFILLVLSVLYTSLTFSQTVASDFSADDCNGISHSLYTEMDEGKVIVIAWVMPCFSCLAPALAAYTAVENFESSHPGQVKYYLVDDYANTSCSSLSSWANSNGLGESDAIISSSSVNMSDYGIPGMPKIIVVGCSGHKVYYNMNYTANGIETAISEALSDCNFVSINDFDNSFNFSLFPNPSQDIITVSYSIIKSSKVINIDVLNVTGEMVLNLLDVIPNSGLGEFQFNTDRLSDGLYFLRMQTNVGTKTVKFSVAH
ncbi:MAG: T9SS type A sorting domain-containing protein [Bacteroidales bacterium]|nr:T9SS type A sorting domain-containing protein [Bacteroidales bacterium]MCF8454843.1 T9SS type A sorting domain-containing protein [Bacteroidales bacterium]